MHSLVPAPPPGGALQGPQYVRGGRATSSPSGILGAGCGGGASLASVDVASREVSVDVFVANSSGACAQPHSAKEIVNKAPTQLNRCTMGFSHLRSKESRNNGYSDVGVPARCKCRATVRSIPTVMKGVARFLFSCSTPRCTKLNSRSLDADSARRYLSWTPPARLRRVRPVRRSATIAPGPAQSMP